MARSTHASAFSALTARGLRAAILGASLISLACSTQHAAPLNPTNFSLGDFEAAPDLSPVAFSGGLVPNTLQLVRLAADTTRCLAVSDELTKRGNPVIISKCGSNNPRQQFKLTTDGQLLTSANSCIGAVGEKVQRGSPVGVTSCEGKPGSRWSYDAAQRLANAAGGCFTIEGIALTAAAKAHLGPCASPVPWSQKLWWNTPGTPGQPHAEPAAQFGADSSPPEPHHQIGACVATSVHDHEGG